MQAPRIQRNFGQQSEAGALARISFLRRTYRSKTLLGVAAVVAGVALLVLFSHPLSLIAGTLGCASGAYLAYNNGRKYIQLNRVSQKFIPQSYYAQSASGAPTRMKMCDDPFFSLGVETN